VTGAHRNALKRLLSDNGDTSGGPLARGDCGDARGGSTARRGGGKWRRSNERLAVDQEGDWNRLRRWHVTSRAFGDSSPARRDGDSLESERASVLDALGFALLKGLRSNRGGLSLADAEWRNSVVGRCNRHLLRDVSGLTSGGGFGGLANGLLASVSRSDKKGLDVLNELLLSQAEVIVE
jgi:hypothetical protein